ncbi:uncharacterized protein LOC120901655 [Anopheles arabiensis]|uniref:Uncharacterized protein n=1 Tax=Anopheles arabiensis TaxID=7173 RepID=A0A182HN77_ANOAR|nr:uncharacterized protein LOC120901655 [Anopheles arabiensis]
MSSKGKRSSILKKQHSVPDSVGRNDPKASSSATGYKSLRKIEFNRKKSVKEFIVGEDVDTIWGNSYEVSTDATPSSGLEDATLGNNSTCRDEQNKENRSTNQLPSVDDSLRGGTINTTNTSWDLSITLADDERRKLRSDTSAVFSQSLNTTERLLVEPFPVPQQQPPITSKVKLKLNGLSVDEGEVQAMDISPIKPGMNPSPTKSPRKMIYTFPKQAMFVEINDVPPGGAKRSTVQSDEQKTPIQPAWRTGGSSFGKGADQTTLRGTSSYCASETWNSHPHALYQGLLGQTRASGELLANVSSDVDTTIALTNAMTQVLQSCSNESIQKATNMELDESTTTLPSNALARARPSFLPSQQRPAEEEDESPEAVVRTPPNGRQDGVWEETKSADLSSPVEGHVQRASLSLENISILAEPKQPEDRTKQQDRLTQQPDVDKSSCSTGEPNGNGLMIDFGLSSLSLKLGPSSPEMPVVTKPRILRPTLPASLLESATKQSEPAKSDAADGHDRSRSIKHTPRMMLSRQKTVVDEEEASVAIGTKSLVSLDISTASGHASKSSFAPTLSRRTVGMEESPKQAYRATVFHSNDIVIDRVEGVKGADRATIVCDEKMELTGSRHTHAGRPTLYDPQPIVEEPAPPKHPSTVERMKRGTVHSAVVIDESDCSPHSPQTALANYRRTVYPLDGMKEEENDTAIVPRSSSKLTRKTITPNDDMVLDVCATPNGRSGADASISCIVYGRNVDELSIQAISRSNAVGVQFARATTFQSQLCEESSSVQIVRERPTLMQVENMALEDGGARVPRQQRLTTHVLHAMEEDDSVDVPREKESDRVPSTKARKSNFNAEGMELTLVEETNENAHQEEKVEERFTTHHDAEEAVVMDESVVEENVQPYERYPQPHGEERKADTVRQQSRIPRLTTHAREDMEGIMQRTEEPVRVKPRHSTYEREDMDVTKLDCDAAIPDRETIVQGLQVEADKESVLATELKLLPKTRLSIYEQEDMNATNICEDDPPVESSHTVPQSIMVPSLEPTDGNSFRMDLTDPESHVEPELHYKLRPSTYQKEPMDVTHVAACQSNLDSEQQQQHQHDVTNYNTFLERYEMSHDTGHGSSVVPQRTEHFPESQFNCTRLSKAYEQQEEVQPMRSRASSYHAEAMDETHIGGQEKMPMSPAAEVKPNNAPRQSTYHAEAMDSTQLAQRAGGKSSFGWRSSNLQSIARQSAAAAIDMEGISVLESDETDPRLSCEPSARGTIFFSAPAVMEDDRTSAMHQLPTPLEEQPKGRTNNNRFSIYDAAAMVEETVPMNHLKLRQAQKPSLDGQERGGTQRKSNDCMDETIVPENIRVERNVRYTRQSFARLGGSIESFSPYLCPAQPIPTSELYRPSTHAPAEEAMELTAAVVSRPNNLVGDGKRNRQTIHQAASMDLTLVGRETPPTMTRPVAATDRRTIYHAGAMEETPPHGGKGEIVPQTVSTATPQAKTVPAVEQKQRRKPRQTILIPQDMDVEDEQDSKEEKEEIKRKEEQQPSFALSMLPRETTEDYVPRSASLLPRRAFVQPPFVDDCPEFAKPNAPEQTDLYHRKHLSHVMARKTDIASAHELSDISMSTSAMRPELPCIGNITAMMSMREITEPLPPASFQEHSNSVSVICRAASQQAPVVQGSEQEDDEPVGLQTLAFVPTRPNGASDDEFYDAEDEPVEDQPVDPLSLTRSTRHLTMKFVDVDQLEQTNAYDAGGKVSMSVPSITSSKRLHSQVLCSPIVERRPSPAGDDCDPLQMTHVRQTLTTAASNQTPNGPIKKRARTSCTVASQMLTEKEEAAAPEPETSEIEQVYVKEERQSVAIDNCAARSSQTLIHDPSVFVLEEENLLDDESDIACASMAEETQPEPEASSTAPPTSVSSCPRLSRIAELSYYKDFANLTLENLDSWEGGTETPTPPNGEQQQQQQQHEDDLVAECISVSDEDSLIVTPPKVPLAARKAQTGMLLEHMLLPNGGGPEGELLESTIASEIMYQIRQQRPVVEHPCCGMPTECICPLRREVKRRQEASDLVWNRWCTQLAAIRKRTAASAGSPAAEDEERPKSFAEQIEELDWQLQRGQFDERFLFVKGGDELWEEDVSRRRSRTAIPSGHYPETPSIALLADNLRSFLAEQLYAVDDGPPTGASLPAVPRITQLIANKLATDCDTRWTLDCSEEDAGVLQFRHRTLRSFVLCVQLQPPRGKAAAATLQTAGIQENWRLERIQVRECQQEYVHSPKLLLAHIEFMRLVEETTEQTLRSTYRTVGDLMGLWHRFNEQLERVFEVVNRLLTIMRNNDAVLHYDAQMERFCLKKCFHRTGDDGLIEANVLLVHFNWIGCIGAPSVSFRWPMADLPHKLLPAGHAQPQHGAASSSTSSGWNLPKGVFVGTDHKAGLMFLECLLWNVTKQYES